MCVNTISRFVHVTPYSVAGDGMHSTYNFVSPIVRHFMIPMIGDKHRCLFVGKLDRISSIGWNAVVGSAWIVWVAHTSTVGMRPHHAEVVIKSVLRRTLSLVASCEGEKTIHVVWGNRKKHC